jgi:hypothetical protein
MYGELCTLPAFFLKIIFNFSFLATPSLALRFGNVVDWRPLPLTNRVVVQKQRVDLFPSRMLIPCNLLILR